MALSSSLTFAQANIADASAQIDAAVLRGDKAEAQRLLPILRALIAAEAAA